MNTKFEMNTINPHDLAVETEIVVRDDFSWDARVNFGAGWRSVGYGMEHTAAAAKAAAESARDAAIARTRKAY